MRANRGSKNNGIKREMSPMKTRFGAWLGVTALGAALVMASTVPAAAQTAIKFTLDWVFQGPTSPFVVALEMERLQMSLDLNILTPYVKANGMGDVEPERFARAVKDVADAFGLPKAPDPAVVFTNKYLPPKADRLLK